MSSFVAYMLIVSMLIGISFPLHASLRRRPNPPKRILFGGLGLRRRLASCWLILYFHKKKLLLRGSTKESHAAFEDETIGNNFVRCSANGPMNTNSGSRRKSDSGYLIVI